MTSPPVPPPLLRPNKKAKLDDDGDDDDDDEDPAAAVVGNNVADDDITCRRAWRRWQNYLDSCCVDDGEGGGDVDELVEIVELLEAYYNNGEKNETGVVSSTTTGTIGIASVSEVRRCRDLLPALGSVASTLLADEAIQKYLSSTTSCRSSATNSDDDGEEILKEIRTHLCRAARYMPSNASAWSMATNLARLCGDEEEQHQKTPPLRLQTPLSSYYLYAADTARRVRRDAVRLLDDGDDEEDGEKDIRNNGNEERDEGGNTLPPLNVKEWIESLLLHQVTGVELLDGDSGTTSDDDDNNDDGVENTDEDEGEEGEYWSCSAVESTARFMAATLLFMEIGNRNSENNNANAVAMKKEALVKQQLEQYFDCTHCLHPNVWKGCSRKTGNGDDDNNNGSTEDNQILAIRGIDDEEEGGPPGATTGRGILPRPLYERICCVFAPDSAYWKQSSYDQRGYFSFFMDCHKNKDEGGATTTNAYNSGDSRTTNNLMRELIEDHLLPILRERFPKEAGEVCGFEWWVHTRPVSSSVGHNLHFDTDETLLRRHAAERKKKKNEGRCGDGDDDEDSLSSAAITHPIFSSVLYLTGDESSGPTIVFNQTPNSTQVATKCWRNVPHNNSLLIFPGNLLHGVLPCPGDRRKQQQQQHQNHQNDDEIRNGLSENNPPDMGQLLSCLRPRGEMSNPVEPPKHRLTLLVGFWTRRVPDQHDKESDKAEEYYRPCGPIPPAASEEHSWVKLLEAPAREDNGTPCPSSSSRRKYQGRRVPVVEPAWQSLQPRTFDSSSSPPLEIPRAMDHRFFVKGAPRCFRDSLFEDDDDDDGDRVSDGEEEEEEEGGDE